MIGTLLLLGAKWLIGALVVAAVLVGPITLIAHLALLRHRRQRRGQRQPPPPMPITPEMVERISLRRYHATVDLTPEQVQALVGRRVRGEHPSHDPLHPNPLMSETEVERVERHRRMQIGEFSPRRRHDER